MWLFSNKWKYLHWFIWGLVCFNMIPSNTSLLSCYLISWRLLPSVIFIAFRKWKTDRMWAGGWLIVESHFWSLWQEWHLSQDTVHCEPNSTYPSECFFWPRLICCWVNYLSMLPYITSDLYATLFLTLDLFGCSISTLTCKVRDGDASAVTGICVLTLCWFAIDGV